MVQEVCTLQLLDVLRGEGAVGVGLDGNRVAHVHEVYEYSSSQPKQGYVSTSSNPRTCQHV